MLLRRVDSRMHLYSGRCITTPAESVLVTVATHFYGSEHRHTVHPEPIQRR